MQLTPQKEKFPDLNSEQFRENAGTRKPNCRSATQTSWSGCTPSVRKQAVQQIFGIIKSAVSSTKWYAAPCNCDSRIQQLEDRFIYEIHDIREEFEQSIHKHENINLLNQIQSDNIYTHLNKMVIDSITQTQLNSWNDAVKALDGVEVFLSTLVA